MSDKVTKAQKQLGDKVTKAQKAEKKRSQIMEAFREVSYRVELGGSASAVVRRYRNQIEVAIYDSDNYVIYLNVHQWALLLGRSNVISNGFNELGMNLMSNAGMRVHRVEFAKE
jgi:hypothetical protein